MCFLKYEHTFCVIYFTSCDFHCYVLPLFLVEVDFDVGTFLCVAVFVLWSLVTWS
jgi:hypothetical protein